MAVRTIITVMVGVNMAYSWSEIIYNIAINKWSFEEATRRTGYAVKEIRGNYDVAKYMAEKAWARQTAAHAGWGSPRRRHRRYLGAH